MLSHYFRSVIWRNSRLLSLSASVPATSTTKQTSTTFGMSCRNISISQKISAPPTEQAIIEQLRVKFPNATDIAVVDTSGGCGAMFEVFIEAPNFKGLRLVKQHQLVNEALKTEIKEIHGLRISTAVSPPDS